MVGVQISALVLIRSVELRCHNVHPLLFGDFAVLVSIHKKQQLPDLALSDERRATSRWRIALAFTVARLDPMRLKRHKRVLRSL